MTSASASPLPGCYKARLDLWRSASIELSIGTEITDPLVQTGIEAVLALLRADATTPTALLDVYGQPHGPLGSQLHLVGSLLYSAQARSDQPARLCWWVVKTAYYRRWLELNRPPDTQPPNG